jgi:hypothetical protein
MESLVLPVIILIRLVAMRRHYGLLFYECGEKTISIESVSISRQRNSALFSRHLIGHQ